MAELTWQPCRMPPNHSPKELEAEKSKSQSVEGMSIYHRKAEGGGKN